MTTINIYENKQEDYTKYEDLEKELNDIKELCGLILQDNHDLKTQLNVMKGIISRLEKRNEHIIASKLKKDSIETITSALQSLNEIEEDRKEHKLKKETITNIDNTVKDNGLTVFQEQILDLLPSFSKNEAHQYMLDVRRRYDKADKEGRKALLNEVWTINRLMEHFNVSRWEIEKNTIKGKLLNEDLIGTFRIVESNPNSRKVLYKITKKNNLKNNTKTNGRHRKSKGKRITDLDSKFEILPVTAKESYNNVELLPDGSIKHITNRNREIILKYDIYDILFIKSVSDKDTFTMGDFKELSNLREDWDRHSLFKLIYNIRENKQFHKIMETAIHKIKEERDFGVKGDLLLIDNNVTYIPVHQVEAWINSYANSNKTREEYIWRLQKRFPEINKDCIAIILYNINNNELTKLWRKKDDVEPFVENNPSKRKNLIQNGGLL